jgi:hypothetical protein
MLKSLDRIYIERNQGRRPARALAVLDDFACCEYSMPNGTTSLAFVRGGALARSQRILHDLLPTFTPTPLRPCSYHDLPKRWLEAIVAQAGDWHGNSFVGLMPSPQEVLDGRESQRKHQWPTQGWVTSKGTPCDYKRKCMSSAGPGTGRGRSRAVLVDCAIVYCRIGADNDPFKHKVRRGQSGWRFALYINGKGAYYAAEEHFNAWGEIARRAEELAVSGASGIEHIGLPYPAELRRPGKAMALTSKDTL